MNIPTKEAAMKPATPKTEPPTLTQRRKVSGSSHVAMARPLYAPLWLGGSHVASGMRRRSNSPSTNNPRLEWLVISICSVLTAFATAAESGRIPSLGDVATNVVKATVPAKSYRVSIQQTIEESATNTVSAKEKSLAHPTPSVKKQSAYALHYTPHKGFRTETVPLSESTNVSAATTSNIPTARLSINIPNFLKEIQAWPTNSVTEDVLNGKTCYKVSASNRDVSAVFWANVENNCILKVVVDIQGKRFAESTFSYRFDKENGWLLEGAETWYATDDSHVLLKYGNYDFSAK